MTQLTFKTLNNRGSNISISSNSTNNEEIVKEIITELSRADSSIPAQCENVLDSNLENLQSISIDQSITTEKKIYPYSIKIRYLALFGFSGLMGPLASDMNVPALEAIALDFKTDYSTATLTVTGFLIAIGIGPLIWAMLSDAYGRKHFSVSSLALFALGSVGCALSISVEMLIAMRFIQGLGSSASMVIGIGVISDIFPKSEIGRAIGAFTVGPLLGPIIGPIIGGYMSQYVGWRSIFYLLTGSGAALAILVAIFYKETMDLSRKLPAPITRNNETGKLEFGKSLPNPFSCLLFLKHVDVVLLCIWASIIFSSYYTNLLLQPITIGKLYNLSSSQVGLTFISIGVGNIFGSAGTGYMSDCFVNRYTSKHNGQASPPELRLKVTIIGAIVIIAAILMNGWFISYGFPLPAILFAQFLIGSSMTNINSGISSYYVENFRAKSSSVYACNSSFRIVITAVISVIDTPLYNSIGPGYIFTFFASLQVLGLLILACMIYYGPKIRSITRK